MFPPRTQYVERDGHLIAYQVFGTGLVDLLLCNGMSSNIDLAWDIPRIAARLQRLSAFSRVIFFDRSGTGASDRLPLDQLPTWEDWADDIGVVLDAANSSRAVLCGDRDGGLLAMTYAAAHPDRTAALVLYNTSARYLVAPDYPIGLPSVVLDQILKIFSTKWGTEEMISVFMPSVAKDPDTLRLLARQLRGACTPTAATAYFHYMLRFDARAVLASISAPTLVLHKRDFTFTGIAHGRYLAEHIRGAKLKELPGRDSALLSSSEGEEAFDAIAEFVTGAPGPIEPDRVLATVLFCDMVNSTGEASVRGDRAWHETLNQYLLRLRETVGRFGGRETTAIGDGVLVAFDRPSRAVRCAVAIRDAVQSMGLDVRCGLHTGECVLCEQQLSGIAVHIGARVAENAMPGEVWVSATVRDLVAGSGLGFAERGAHELRGIHGSFSLFAVT